MRVAALRVVHLLLSASVLPLSSAVESPTTISDAVKHESGRCSMRGQCGSENFFSSSLPCPYNGLAEKPAQQTREKLVDICGTEWSEGAICCDDDQIKALEENLKQASQLIFPCPACQKNFYNLFCTFTCSPDQSLFVNVTDTTETTSGETAVIEVDNLWSPTYKKSFYDSCKDVKFGALGTSVMDFFGNAKNEDEFLAFLGRKSLVGSPFQINFPDPAGREKEGMKAANPTARACNDPDEKYRCACVDCPASCPKLPDVASEEDCYVGVLPCLSFGSVLVYAVLVALIISAVVGHVAYRRHAQRQNERLRLLQDATPSDDEDEGDVVHNAGMLDRPQRNYKINSLCDTAFARLGGLCARYPLVTIGSSVLVVVLLSLGWLRFEVVTDPVRLWVSPDSNAAQEKAFFDDNFGPFYRTEQVFLVNDTDPTGPGPVLSYDILRWWFDVETQISRLTPRDAAVTLQDVCFNPTGDACVVQSVTGYFQGDFGNVDPSDWEAQLRQCIESPASEECRPLFQQPLQKDLVIGGLEAGQDVLQATAMVVTWVVNNHPEGSEAQEKAMLWEASLRDLLKIYVQPAAKDRGLRLSFSTEISLEEELSATSNTDARIVVISYVIMFVYVSFALGSASLTSRAFLNNPATAMVQSKFTLGISGIIIVLMSVSASVGLFAAAGVQATLIIAEVIPFLVLAVGVDNIFLIVHELERVNHNHPDEEIDVRVAKALGRMGPSILLSALTETVAFVLGVFVGMPAVKNFAAYAAGAVVINAILQVTMFVAVLALNQRRVESNRIDCFPFIRINHIASYIRGGVTYNLEEEESPLQRFIRQVYAPALLNRQVKVAIIALFLGFFAAAIALLPEVQLGLDQKIAVPDESYLISYFKDLEAYFNTGPPVYFVTKDVNATKRSEQQTICSRFTTCNELSLPSVLEQESKRSDVSYITGAAADWFDDFFFWLNPTFDECCVEGGHTCFEDRDPAWNITLAGMPEGPEFIHYVEKWLQAPVSTDCYLGGKAGYSTALVVSENTSSIPASHFRTFHVPLRTQDDFISAYASARRIADDISASQDITVFPYSKFYIFFDMYATIVRLTGTLLGTALALILAITSVLLGSVATGAVVTLTVAMIVADVLGTMALAGVSLNAVSLVNLVICVGIGVEFCAHIARAFMFPSRTVMEKAKNKFRGRDARAWTAMVNVGGSVFTGITLTKFVGVCVLAFTRSKIFEIYYFRIWLSLVVWAALHALVFLPVVLSLVGGEGKSRTPLVSNDVILYANARYQATWIPRATAASTRTWRHGGTARCCRTTTTTRTSTERVVGFSCSSLPFS